MKITIQDGHQTAKIERVYIDKPYAAPGEDVAVTAVIKPFNAAAEDEVIHFQVPRDAPDGNLVIGVAGGQEYDYIKNRLGIIDPEPENVRQIARRIQDEGRGDQIALVVGLPDQSLMVNGTKLVNPPAYWAKVFFSNRHTKGPTLVKGEMKKLRDEPWMLSGSHIIALEVRSPDKAASRSAELPIAAPFNNSEDISITEQARKAMESFPGFIHKLPGAHALGGENNNTPNNNNSTLSAGFTTSVGAPTPQPAPTTTTKPATTQTTLTEPTGKGYPHVRPLQIWRQDSDDEFREGKLDDATVDSWGRISPGLESLGERHGRQLTNGDQIWSGIWSAGNFYFGSSHELWRWKGDSSKAVKLADLDGVLVSSITADSKGRLYAAAVPSGHVWTLDPQSNAPAHIMYTASEPIITSLAVDDDNNLLVGTANSGRVYRVSTNGNGKAQGSLLFDSGQSHVLCLFYCHPEHTLYLGTGEKGSLYAIDKTGKARAVYQSPDHFVTGVVKDRRGDIYVASAGQGHLVRVTPNGEASTLASSEAFYTLHYDAGTDSIFSGDAEGDITMACIDAMTKQPYFMPVCHTEQEAVLALASDGKNLYAGTSNLAVLRSFRMQLSGKPLYTSAVKDGGRTTQWLRIHPFGASNEINKELNSTLKFETRTGETASPDETWSPWQPAVAKDSSFSIASPQARYYQYKLTWNSAADSSFSVDKIDSLRLGRIDTTFLPTNSAPTISHVSVKADTALSGKTELSITGTDPDGDNLLASIDISADDGKTWQPVKDNLRSKSAKKESKSEDGDDKDADKDKEKDKEKLDTDKSAEKESTESPSKDDASATTSGDKPDSSSGKKPDADSGDKDKNQGKDKDAADGAAGKSKTKAVRARHLKLNAEENRLNTDEDATAEKDSDNAEKSSPDKAKSADSDKKDAKKDKPQDKTASKDKKGKQAKAKPHATTANSDSKGANESSGPSSESFSYNFDTSKLKDGNYLLRITVDDSLSNPAHHEEVVNLRSVTIDNTPPEIQLIDYHRQPGGKLEFKIKATDKLTAIANAIYKIDDGDPFALSFDPDSIDALTATLTASDVKVASGSHKLEVKISDRAGNTATKTITIR